MNNYNNQSILGLKSIFCNQVSSNDIFETNDCEIIVFKSNETRNGILIDIKSKIIGNFEVSLLYKLLAWLKKEQISEVEIFILLPEDLENFSSAFVSTIYLLNKGFNSEIYIYGQDSNSRTYEFIHMMYSGQLAPESDYFFKINTYSQPNDTPKIWGLINRGNANRYVASEKNLPLIPITQINNQELFVATLSNYLSDNISTLISTDDNDYKAIFKKFQSNYPDDSKLDDFKKQFYALHFLRLLDNLHCLEYFCMEKSRAKIDDNYYQKILSTIINPLLDAPVFLSLILYLLLDEKSVKSHYIQIYNKETNESRKNFNKILISFESNNTTHTKILLAYSEFVLSQLQLASEIYKGVYELVKNTIEHSANKRGVLTVRKIKNNEFNNIKNENRNVWTEYVSSVSEVDFIDKDKKSFIDISIVDDGDKGIIENSLEELYRLGNSGKRNITKEIAVEDISRIKYLVDKKEAELLFKMYFNPNEFYLTRQAQRAMGSYGLFIFTKFIHANNGIFNVQTNSNGNNSKTISFYSSTHSESYTKESSCCPFGTSYNITIPVVRKKVSIKGEYVHIKEYGESEITLPDSLFRRMLTFHPERRQYLNLNNELTNIDGKTIIDIKTEKEIVLLLSIDNKTDRSGLLRLLFKIFVDNKINAIIVKNINEKLLNDYLDLFFEFSAIDEKLLPHSKAIFFYLDDKPQSLFVLAGQNITECNMIYSTIVNNQLHESAYKYNGIELINDCNEFPNHLISKSKTIKNPLFVDKNLIVRLDFLDTDENGLTKFEQKAKEHLETDLNSDNNTGYKWSGTHLKIGSKLHLEDFIYGKKLFQKNYEASRFAYSLALHFFHREYKEFLGNATPTNYTFIGYGFYSELLVSRIREFVKYLFDYTESDDLTLPIISYAIVKDEEEIRFSKFLMELKARDENAIEKVVIIVPISSTLTTCLKIENAFRKVIYQKYKTTVSGNDKFRIFSPFYSVVVVGDREENKVEQNINTEDSIISNYWSSIDIHSKIIKTINREEKIANNISERENYYKLYLESKWNHVENCPDCFPVKYPLDEKPLFMTDKVAVTPTLVFNSHQWQESKPNNKSPYFRLNKDDKFLFNSKYIDDSMLNVVHYKGQDKDFQYYLRYTDIVSKNKDFIEEWSKNTLKNENEIYEKTLLIAPDKSENGDFIHLINRCVFQERANVIKVDPYGDYYLNFDQFFGAEVKDAKKIYFIDNLIATGNTFSLIYDNLKIIDEDIDKKIKGVIILINRMDYESFKRFATKTNKLQINAFFEINVPVIVNPNRYCPMCEEEKVYKDLCENSSLDIIRQYFNAKELPYYTPISKEDLIEGTKYEIEKHQESSILKLLFTHYINKAFSEYKSGSFIDVLKNGVIKKYDNYNFDSFAADLKEYIQKEDTCNLSEDSLSNIRFKSNIVKVLAQYPFKRYRGINIAVFYWVLNDLVLITDYILNGGKKEDRNDLNVFSRLTYIQNNDIDRFIDCLNYLRVLIKYGGILKIAYLLHTDFIKAINKLINSELFIELLKVDADNNHGSIKQSLLMGKEEKLKEMKYSLINFKIFTVAHISKSLQGVESRALKLEENLFQVREEAQDKNSILASDFSFLDILTLENTKIINEFFDCFNLSISDKKEEVYNSIAKSYKYDSKIKNFISFYKIGSKLQAKTNEEIIHDFDFKSFVLNLIEINNLIGYKNNDQNDEEEDFEEKAKHLTKSIASILGYDLENGGGFLLYKYQKISKTIDESKNTIVLGKVGNTSLADIFENAIPDTSVTSKMLNGFEYTEEENVLYKWTNYSIIKKDDQWVGQNNNKTQDYESTIINNDYRRIIFCRISDLKLKDNKKNENDKELNGRAVFVFYDNKFDAEDKWSINRVRYVHVFRNKILKYFDKNYNSDSFRAWIEQKEKAAYMYSLNHGIEVYEDTVEFYRNKISLELTKAEFDNSKKELQQAIKYLTNKINLMSLYSKLEVTGEFKSKQYVIRDLISELNNNYKFILTFNREAIYSLQSFDFLNWDIDINGSEKEEVFDFPDGIIPEMIFELIYNIRKHVVHTRQLQIKSNKLNIKVSLVRESNVLYLSIMNNHFDNKISNIEVFNSRLNMNTKDGLCLINNILRKTIEERIIVRAKDHRFTINIPLKKLTQ